MLFDGFMAESKWLATKQRAPGAEDYLRNGVVTSGVPLIFAHLFYLLGQDHVASTNEDAAKPLSDASLLPSLVWLRSSDFGMTWAVPRSAIKRTLLLVKMFFTKLI